MRVHAGRHEDISDTLAGQGERLAVRIADQGIVEVRDKGDFLSVIDKLSVRLVRDDEQLMPVLFLRRCEHLAHHGKRFFTEYCAGWVIGRIDDNRLHALVKRIFKRLDIRLHTEVGGRNNDHLRARVLDKHLVLREKRSQHDDLVSRIAQRLYRNGEGRRRAAGHVNAVHGNIIARTSALGLCRGFARADRAGRGGIAVQVNASHVGDKVDYALVVVRVCGLKGFLYRGCDFRDVKFDDFVLTERLFSRGSVCRNLTDDLSAFAELNHVFGQHF